MQEKLDKVGEGGPFGVISDPGKEEGEAEEDGEEEE